MSDEVVKIATAIHILSAAVAEHERDIVLNWASPVKST